MFVNVSSASLDELISLNERGLARLRTLLSNQFSLARVSISTFLISRRS